jgi:hypothetical protein
MKEKGFANKETFNHERKRFCEEVEVELLAMK